MVSQRNPVEAVQAGAATHELLFAVAVLALLLAVIGFLILPATMEELRDIASSAVDRLRKALGAELEPALIQRRLISAAELSAQQQIGATRIARWFKVDLPLEDLMTLGGAPRLRRLLLQTLRDAAPARGWVIPDDADVLVMAGPRLDVHFAYTVDPVMGDHWRPKHRRPIRAATRAVVSGLRTLGSGLVRAVRRGKRLTARRGLRHVAARSYFKAAAGVLLVLWNVIYNYVPTAIRPTDPVVLVIVALVAHILDYVTTILETGRALSFLSVLCRTLRPWGRAAANVLAFGSCASAVAALIIVAGTFVPGALGQSSATPKPTEIARATVAPAKTEEPTPATSAPPTASPAPRQTATPSDAPTQRPAPSAAPTPPPVPSSPPSAVPSAAPPRTPEPTGQHVAAGQVRWDNNGLGRLIAGSSATGTLEAGQVALVTSGDGLVAGHRCGAGRAGRMCAFLILAATRYGYRADELVPGHAWIGQTLGSHRPGEVLESKMEQFFEPGSCGPVACDHVSVQVSVNGRHVCVVEVSRGQIIAVALVVGAESLCPAEFAAMRAQVTTRYLLEWWVPPLPVPCGVIVSSTLATPPPGAVGTHWLIHSSRVDGHLAELGPRMGHCPVERRA